MTSSRPVDALQLGLVCADLASACDGHPRTAHTPLFETIGRLVANSCTEALIDHGDLFDVAPSGTGYTLEPLLAGAVC